MVELKQLADKSPVERRKVLVSQANLLRSVGPWLVFDDAEPVFDGVSAGMGLGYNSTPLFGTIQHPESWSNGWSEETTTELREAITRYFGADNKFGSLMDGGKPRTDVRSYIALNIIEQFPEEFDCIGTKLAEAIAARSARVPELERAISVEGNKIFIDFNSRHDNPLELFLDQRVLAGISSGSFVDIRIPLLSTSHDIEFLADAIANVWNNNGTATPDRFDFIESNYSDPANNYRFHARLLSHKLSISRGEKLDPNDELRFIQGALPPKLHDSRVTLIGSDNWPLFRERVAAMQEAVYEPVRQTPIKKFDQLFADPFGFGLVVEVDDSIAGMAFAGPLELFPDERGTLDDPYRSDRHTLYVLDLTVAAAFRGALGKILKQGITLYATAAGHNAIHGRNRDRLAAGMWAINLGMGSFETRRLIDDYPDQQPYRDCIYYRCPLRWPSDAAIPEFDPESEAGLKELARIVNG